MKLNKNQIKKFKSINKEYLVNIINKADLDIEKILEKKTLVYNGTVLSEDNWRVALVQVTAMGIKPAEYTELLEHFGIANSTIQKEKSIIKKAIETATPYKVRKPLEYGITGKPKTALERHLKEMADLAEKAEFKIAAVAEARGVIFSEEDKVYLRKDKPFLFEEKYYRDPELGTPDPLLLQAKEQSEKQKKYAASQTLINYVKRSKPKSTKSKMEKEIEMAYKSRSKK